MTETPKHTPGRLHVGPPGSFSINAENGHGICEVLHYCDDPGFDNKQLDIEPKANAERLVAAWNACLDIPTEALEAGVVKELLEACIDMANAADAKARIRGCPYCGGNSAQHAADCPVAPAYAAITNAKGE